ncbi:MAG TPA: DUF2793 domain-containing protein [Rhizomicrobium sp.]|jgi:hypothetical protein|nr:DUF2793 domain-containing protein [Rhizomicrobium sp.]
MTTTPRTALPLLAAAQAQKHVTHNDALLQLDALLFARFLDRDLSAPPSSPADGDTYLVKATASGAWTGQSNKIAYVSDGAWRFAAPFTGLAAYVVDESKLIVFTGSAWVDYASILSLQNVPLLGVNTTADTTNKFATKSAALLFDNIGNGVQAKLNKHAASDTASLLYQTNYSGRAEMGLAGDDNFHLKVSPDGAAWTEAVFVDKTTGRVGLGTASPDAPLTLNLTGSASIVAPPTNIGIHVVGNTTTNRQMIMETYGTSPLFGARATAGTIAAPTAVTSGMGLFNFSSSGYDGTNFAAAAGLNFYADETWTSSAHGAHWAMRATPLGGLTIAETFSGYGDGRWSATGARCDASYARQVPVTGFSITIANACGRLILDPASALASGAITLPASPRDGQICKIASSQAIAALTLSPNTGQSLAGALTALTANGFAEYTYVAANTAWYRTG